MIFLNFPSLSDLRGQIDEIDEKIIDLFQKRMDVSTEIARYKRRHNLPVYDPVREGEILVEISHKTKESYKSDIHALYSLLFELSRAQQERVLNQEVTRC